MDFTLRAATKNLIHQEDLTLQISQGFPGLLDVGGLPGVVLPDDVVILLVVPASRQQTGCLNKPEYIAAYEYLEDSAPQFWKQLPCHGPRSPEETTHSSESQGTWNTGNQTLDPCRHPPNAPRPERRAPVVSPLQVPLRRLTSLSDQEAKSHTLLAHNKSLVACALIGLEQSILSVELYLKHHLINKPLPRAACCMLHNLHAKMPYTSAHLRPIVDAVLSCPTASGRCSSAGVRRRKPGGGASIGGPGCRRLLSLELRRRGWESSSFILHQNWCVSVHK